MRKFTKKLVCILTAAALSAGALSLTACGEQGFTPVEPDTFESVESNGGFVVATNDYYYFINGVETYSSDNTYGGVVKGALMRVKKTDVEAKKNTAETVIPSLMVAGDYTSGIFLYGDRIYYATPNNVRNTAGVIENDYLDFKSVKTDGTDIKNITRTSSNTVQYRYIEKEGAVYLVYVDGTKLVSRNISTSEETVLADGGTYLFHDTDKTDPYVYYTMSVTDQQDTDNSVSYSYNQIYRVSIDATEAAYEYVWNQEWLDENNNGEAPYVNLGELVLDGISKTDSVTQFNHDVDEENDNRPAMGYTYTLQNYVNGGIYFTRNRVSKTDSTLDADGKLYYLSESEFAGEAAVEWHSVSGNDSLDVVADGTNVSKATSSALFYIDGEGHHYLYVSGSSIYRADADGNGGCTTQEIAYDASGASLVSLDMSDETYHYVYFSRTNGNGLSVERAVFNGEPENYENLQLAGNDNTPYEAVKLLDIQHASGWYPFEIIDNNLFYANAESFGSSLNYIYTVNLKQDGALMDNAQLKAFNEKFDSIVSDDSKVGYLTQVKTDGNASYVSSFYSDALKYFFYTGETELFYENIRESVEAGKKETYLYSQTEQDAFKAFTAGEAEDCERFFLDDDGNSYFSLAYFTTALGKQTEEDAETYNNYWKTSVLRSYPLPEDENTGLEWWAWLLIGIAIAAVVAGGTVAVVFVLRKRGKDDEPKPEKMRVDTTDDKDVDVYHMNEEEVPAEPVEEPADDEPAEPAEEPTEEPAETEEAAAEETAEAEEAPADTPQETAVTEENEEV